MEKNTENPSNPPNPPDIDGMEKSSRTRPRVAKIEPMAERPLFRALGTIDLPGCERRYVIELRSRRLLVWRASQLIRLPALLEIHPDAAHWRCCYPAGAKGIDARAAAAEIMRQADEAGPVDPATLPEGVRPRPVGRPRGRG